MNKRIFFVLYYVFSVLSLSSQSINVSNFKLLDSDLTANTAGTMEQDQNGEVAALIKVVTTQTGFSFDCGAMGIVKTLQKPSEIWVYVPRGVKKMTISHPQLGLLRDYFFPIPIEAARTYELVLVSGNVQTIVQQARTSQYVVFQLNPPNAIVELDGALLQTVDGTASKMMKFGSYDYRVQAPNYLPESGKVTIDDPDNKKVVSVTLKPNFSKVSVKVDNNAEIWINGEKKGNGTWTGDLGEGTYEFEAKLQGHRSTLITKDLVVTQEPQTINLPTPTPIYGEADINSSPAMADIYIDGQKKGQTPQLISNLLVGSHQLRLSKEGYGDHNSTLIIKEGETTSFSVAIEKRKEHATPAINDTKKDSESVENSSINKTKSLAESYLEQKDFNNAIKYYQEYLDSNSELTFEDEEGFANIYIKYSAEKKSKRKEYINKALEIYKNAAIKYPERKIYATYKCAELKNRLDDNMKMRIAKAEYQEVATMLSQKTNRSEDENTMLKYSLHYLMFCSYLDQDISEAKQYAKKIIAIDPEYKVAHDVLNLK